MTVRSSRSLRLPIALTDRPMSTMNATAITPSRAHCGSLKDASVLGERLPALLKRESVTDGRRAPVFAPCAGRRGG